MPLLMFSSLPQISELGNPISGRTIQKKKTKLFRLPNARLGNRCTLILFNRYK